ncbi:alpha/beta-hydrolase [Pseudovirgaria hyperparasitica]|uniref:Alpha/beta-hydrolase n=1 Tax=Pseudovirgaria hyperparasitica TaxID=470096 RepID=A0A6A6WD02_9PEZI|nr:alpha/beta-hydrolase [Pseudovirgaria hyperparasitica]KAF2760059.1 alpha/beta-hydrolase [Pseudovirgaria hyperparasitica]
MEIYQPIHSSIRDKLDPQYIAFHDKYMQYIVPDEWKPWDASVRTETSLPNTSSTPAEVGAIQDFSLGSFSVRTFVPNEEAPPGGWPVFIWFHGGGWTVGGIDSGAYFCSRACKALISVGGTSAGAVLSLALCTHALTLPSCPAIRLQVLVVPVLDNTASVAGIWRENQHAPWLTPERMLWYRRMWMPDECDWGSGDASPGLLGDDALRTLPKTWLGIAEYDLLAPEARLFAERFRGVGVGVGMKVYTGSTHSLFALEGVLDRGMECIDDCVEVIKNGAW